MRHDKKLVTYKHLSVGQKIHGVESSNRTSWFTGTVKDINPAFVTVMKFDKYEEKYNSEEYKFEVLMSEAEYKAKYQNTAKKILKNLNNRLQYDEIGYHEMWNSWLYCDIYEMADYCEKVKMMVVGYCTDIIPKIAMLSGDTLDIGVCCEYEDGERFWCHYRSSDLKELLDKNTELME